MNKFDYKDKDEFKTDDSIMPDWAIIKQQIWISWFNFLDHISNLVMYNVRGVSSPVTLLSAIKEFYRLCSKINLSRLEEHLSREEFIALNYTFELVKFNPDEVDFFLLDESRGFLEKFFNVSGMGKFEIAAPPTWQEQVAKDLE